MGLKSLVSPFADFLALIITLDETWEWELTIGWIFISPDPLVKIDKISGSLAGRWINVI